MFFFYFEIAACNEASACSAKVVVTCPCGQRRQEVRCQASSTNATPKRPELRCDDDCLRLERNRRLAAALDIDAASHTNSHIPYSETTLRLFKENLSWAETQEREFRLFAQSPGEVRLRYKPMPSTYRQFLHLLAEDYGLESRSEDVEPHRHVVVFKGPRFVSAPSKTISDCLAIRTGQRTAAPARAPSPPPVGPLAQDPFNGFLLLSPRFGLTVEEVTSSLKGDLASQPSIHFTVRFLPTEEVIIKASATYSALLSPKALEQALAGLRPRLAKTAADAGLASSVQLCHLDAQEHIARREEVGPRTDAPGWSAVVGRAAMAKAENPAAPASSQETPVGGSGRRRLELRKKKPNQEKPSPWAALGGDAEC